MIMKLGTIGQCGKPTDKSDVAPIERSKERLWVVLIGRVIILQNGRAQVIDPGFSRIL